MMIGASTIFAVHNRSLAVSNLFQLQYFYTTSRGVWNRKKCMNYLRALFNIDEKILQNTGVTYSVFIILYKGKTTNYPMHWMIKMKRRSSIQIGVQAIIIFYFYLFSAVYSIKTVFNHKRISLCLLSLLSFEFYCYKCIQLHTNLAFSFLFFCKLSHYT